MAYKKVGWKDYPSTDTPINATNLDHMDAGILENAQTIGDKTKISGIGDGTVVGAIAANKSAIDANAEAIAQNTQSLTNLKTFPENGERLIGNCGKYKVYEVSKAIQLNAGFLSFKLCEHNLIQIRSLEAFISAPDSSYIYKANIENGATVVYPNGTMNINLTSQTTANNIITVHCIYLA